MVEQEQVVIFTKPPVPGLVKTRLSPPLTPRQAADVHEASLRDVVATVRATGREPTICFASGPGATAYFAGHFPELETFSQDPGDLGRRLKRTFSRGFAAGFTRIVILGSDAPTLPPPELDRACDELRSADAVAGPARDGGYYLIGLRARSWPAATALFFDIPWSSSSVLATTRNRANEAGVRLRLLRTWYDIDRPSDLIDAEQDAEVGSNLARVLARLPRAS